MTRANLFKKKILFISSTRADYSLQKKLIESFSNNSKFRVFLIVTGSHQSKNYGLTKNEIQIKNCELISIKLQLSKDSTTDITKLFASYLSKFNNIIELYNFDLSILIGDRYEILSSAISLDLNNIPIVHLHGGETTLGSKDNNFRNMISHLSKYHFVSHNIYKKKLISLGIPSKKIFNYGAFCSDNVYQLKNIDLDILRDKLNINLSYQNYFLVTYHPETSTMNDDLKILKNIFKILLKFKKYYFIITASNHENDSLKINKFLLEFSNNNQNFYFFYSLGSNIYLNLLKRSAGIIGNSSSGVIEAPFFKIPTINIGKRQQGRFLHKSILNCGYDYLKIEKNIKKIQNKKFKKDLLSMKNTLIKKNVSKKTYKKIISIL